MLTTLALCAWLAACAVQDLRRRQVDNLLTLGGLAMAAGQLLLTGHSLTQHAPAAALAAAGLGLLLSLPGYLLGKLGAADVKLLAALGLASDPYSLLYALALACLVTVALMLASKLSLESQRLPKAFEGCLKPFDLSRSKSFPFIFSIFCGYLLQLSFR
ncbi:prepilin peptidase CpaA [Pseudomonas delhiensis]|uniref:Prepilin peptidase CpaA n=1 Tax=Pseudomonas delhiensis TaxID=366289 RepID=A0A239GNS5_9PSED|nr:MULTISPECIES: prepilin peptidase [Pseudomonas]SDJ43692.1 prepilin peptidase CpaA [Pseudomonas delhiensis]SNS70143.1 prepilin peptidase CpaA [Pseudomonas delhiensis]